MTSENFPTELIFNVYHFMTSFLLNHRVYNVSFWLNTGMLVSREKKEKCYNHERKLDSFSGKEE